MKNLFITLALTCLISGGAFAGEAKTKNHGKMPMMEMTKEQRQKMADMHDKMAACLRSEKALSDCHKDMMQGCQETMGKDSCPMMDHMGGMMGKGMMHHKDHKDMMQGKDESKE